MSAARCVYCGRDAQPLPALPGRYRCAHGHYFTRLQPSAVSAVLAQATPRQL